MGKPILTDFYADWCGPCKMQGPVFEALAEKMKDVADFRKVNVDREGDLAVEKGILVVPTLILEKDGTEIRRWMGFASEKELTDAINEALK